MEREDYTYGSINYDPYDPSAGNYYSSDPDPTYDIPPMPDYPPVTGHHWEFQDGQWISVPGPGPGYREPGLVPGALTDPPSSGGGASSGGGGGGGGYSGGGGGLSRPAPRTPPAFGDYPMFDAPHYQKPPDFTYADFVPPDPNDLTSNKEFQFVMKQGLDALSNSRAAAGTFRTGPSGQALTGFAEGLANTFYGDYYNRAANTYTTNRGNAFDNYKLNLDAGLSAYDRYFQEAAAEYAPRARAFELQSARDWDAFVFGAEDDWRRYASDVDIAKTIFGGG